MLQEALCLLVYLYYTLFFMQMQELCGRCILPTHAAQGGPPQPAFVPISIWVMVKILLSPSSK